MSTTNLHRIQSWCTLAITVCDGEHPPWLSWHHKKVHFTLDLMTPQVLAYNKRNEAIFAFYHHLCGLHIIKYHNYKTIQMLYSWLFLRRRNLCDSASGLLRCERTGVRSLQMKLGLRLTFDVV